MKDPRLSRDAAGNLLLDGNAFKPAGFTGAGGEYQVDPLLYGSRGQIQTNPNGDYRNNPYYMMVPNSDQEGTGSYVLRPEYEAEMGGRSQLGTQTNTGTTGYGEAMTDDDLQYNDTLGLHAANDRITDPVKPRERMINQIGMLVAAGGMLGPIAAAEFGAGAGSALDLTQVGAGSGFGTGGTTAGGAALGELGSGTTLAGTGLGGGAGALGTGANLAGTGLVSGTGAGLAGTAVTGAELAAGGGALAGLTPVSGAIGSGTGIPAIDSMRDAATRIGSGNMDWQDLARQLIRTQGSGGDSGGSAGGGLIGDIINAYLGSQNPSAMGEFERNRGWSEDMMNQTTRANRPNQNTAFGSSRWNQDPSGQWTQDVTLNPRDQERLDTNRGIQQTALERARDYKPLDTSQFRHRSFGGSYLGF